MAEGTSDDKETVFADTGGLQTTVSAKSGAIVSAQTAGQSGVVNPNASSSTTATPTVVAKNTDILANSALSAPSANTPVSGSNLLKDGLQKSDGSLPAAGPTLSKDSQPASLATPSEEKSGSNTIDADISETGATPGHIPTKTTETNETAVTAVPPAVPTSSSIASTSTPKGEPPISQETSKSAAPAAPKTTVPLSDPVAGTAAVPAGSSATALAQAAATATPVLTQIQGQIPAQIPLQIPGQTPGQTPGTPAQFSAPAPTPGATFPGTAPSSSVSVSPPPYIRKPDVYIPPAKRQLSQETRALLNKPSPSIDHTSPVELLLLKSIGVWLSDHHYSEEFLWTVGNLASRYLHELVKALHKYTEMQRKTKPSKSDMELVLKQFLIKPQQLFDEYKRKDGEVTKRPLASVLKATSETKDDISKKEAIKEETPKTSCTTKSNLVDLISSEAAAKQKRINEYKQKLASIEKLEKETIDIIDPAKQPAYTEEASLLFFMNENYEITELVPKKFGKPNYVPYFLPDLPPDYTYQKTPMFMDRLSDLKDMRIKLVEESRMTEKSLYNLIDNDELKWKDMFEKELVEIEILEDDDMEVDGVAEKKDLKTEKTQYKVQADTETPGNSTAAIAPRIDGKEVQEAISTPLETTQADTVNATPKLGLIVGSVDKSEPQVPITAIEAAKPTLANSAASEQSRFDIVAYAMKEREIRKQKQLKLANKRQLRERNIFFKAERYFSPYATKSIAPDVLDEYLKFADDAFKRVILSVRNAEANKKRKIEEFIKQKETREKELASQREEEEFGFTFGKMSNFHDNDDDEDDDDENDANRKEMGEVFPEFDFPASITRENTPGPVAPPPTATSTHSEEESSIVVEKPSAGIETDTAVQSHDLDTKGHGEATNGGQGFEGSTSHAIEATGLRDHPQGPAENAAPRDEDNNENDEEDDDDDDEDLFDDLVAAATTEDTPKAESVEPSAAVDANSSSDEDDFEDI